MKNSSRIRKTSIELIEQEISEAEDAVNKSKMKYETDLRALKNLLEKREGIRKEQLMKEIAKSKHTYEEILRFIRGADEEEIE